MADKSRSKEFSKTGNNAPFDNQLHSTKVTPQRARLKGLSCSTVKQSQITMIKAPTDNRNNLIGQLEQVSSASKLHPLHEQELFSQRFASTHGNKTALMSEMKPAEQNQQYAQQNYTTTIPQSHFQPQRKTSGVVQLLNNGKLDFTPAQGIIGTPINRQNYTNANRKILESAAKTQSTNPIQVTSGAESLSQLLGPQNINSFCGGGTHHAKTPANVKNQAPQSKVLAALEDQKMSDIGIQMKQQLQIQPTNILNRNISQFPSHAPDGLNLKRSAHFDVSAARKEPICGQRNSNQLQIANNPMFKTPVQFNKNMLSPQNVPNIFNDARDHRQLTTQALLSSTQSSASQVLNSLMSPQSRRIQPRDLDHLTQSIQSLTKSNSQINVAPPDKNPNEPIAHPASVADRHRPYEMESGLNSGFVSAQEVNRDGYGQKNVRLRTPINKMHGGNKPRHVIYNNLRPDHHKTLAVVGVEAQSQYAATSLVSPSAGINSALEKHPHNTRMTRNSMHSLPTDEKIGGDSLYLQKEEVDLSSQIQATKNRNQNGSKTRMLNRVNPGQIKSASRTIDPTDKCATISKDRSENRYGLHQTMQPVDDRNDTEPNKSKNSKNPNIFNAPPTYLSLKDNSKSSKQSPMTPGHQLFREVRPVMNQTGTNKLIQHQLNELHRQVKENQLKQDQSQRSPQPLPSRVQQDNVLVKIKVVNSQMLVVQTFMVQRGTILKHMKYFETQLKDGTDEIVEIEVHCNPQIFQFVIDYINELDSTNTTKLTTQARLTPANFIPILVSANFLQITQLEADCLLYWRLNFIEIMAEQVLPTQQLKPQLASKLCDAIPLSKLQLLEHSDKSREAEKNNEMSEMIFCNHVRNILQNNDLSSHRRSFTKRRFPFPIAQFNVCIVCSEVYLDRYVDKLECRFKALSTSKQTWPMHKIDQEFDFECFLYYLNAEKDVSWKVIHALLLSNSVLLPKCRSCNKSQTYSDLKNCKVHPESEINRLVDISETRRMDDRRNELRFSTILNCCGQHAMWHMPFMMYSDFSLPMGCQHRQHIFDQDALLKGEQGEIIEYLNNVANDDFTYSAVPTTATPPKDKDAKQTKKIKEIRFKDLVEMFGDIIFNFEYRRMVTDFFHPAPVTPVPIVDEKSRKQAQSSLLERRREAITGQVEQHCRTKTPAVDHRSDDLESSEEESDDSIDCIGRHQLTLTGKQDTLQDSDSSDCSDDYYDEEGDSENEIDQVARLPAAYTPEQRQMKRPLQMNKATSLSWNIKPSTRYTCTQNISSTGHKIIKHVFKLYSGHMSRQAVGQRMRTIRKNRIGKETNHFISKFNEHNSIAMLQTVGDSQIDAQPVSIQEQMDKLTQSLMRWRGPEPSTEGMEKYHVPLVPNLQPGRKLSNTLQFTQRHPDHPQRANKLSLQNWNVQKQTAALPNFTAPSGPPTISVATHQHQHQHMQKQPAAMITIEPHYSQEMIAAIIKQNQMRGAGDSVTYQSLTSQKKAQQQMSAGPPSNQSHVKQLPVNWTKQQQQTSQQKQRTGLCVGVTPKQYATQPGESDRSINNTQLQKNSFVDTGGDANRGGTSKHLEASLQAIWSVKHTNSYTKQQQQFKARTAAYIQRLPNITSKSKDSAFSGVQLPPGGGSGPGGNGV